MLTEVWAENSGVDWMGEGGICVFGESGSYDEGGGVEEGMCQKVDRRTVSVKVSGFVFTTTYMLVQVAGNEEIEAAFEVLAVHVGWKRGDEVNVVGGDFNAHVGRDETRRGVCGKFGLRETNRQGDKLLEWCEINSLTYVNSFSNHRNRGTWFSVL